MATLNVLLVDEKKITAPGLAIDHCVDARRPLDVATYDVLVINPSPTIMFNGRTLIDHEEEARRYLLMDAARTQGIPIILATYNDADSLQFLRGLQQGSHYSALLPAAYTATDLFKAVAAVYSRSTTETRTN